MGDPSAPDPSQHDPNVGVHSANDPHTADHRESGHWSVDFHWACSENLLEPHPTLVDHCADDLNRRDPKQSHHRSNGHVTADHCPGDRPRVGRRCQLPPRGTVRARRAAACAALTPSLLRLLLLLHTLQCRRER
jgi:hypothetical protein